MVRHLCYVTCPLPDPRSASFLSPSSTGGGGFWGRGGVGGWVVGKVSVPAVEEKSCASGKKL